MEDERIIDLYWRRDEDAIAETDRKYGPFCHTLALNILSVREDAEECVSDTWYRAWTAIPPLRPEKLRLWLGRIVRNLAINLWHRNHARKRYDGMETMLDELEDCIPSPVTVERTVEDGELGEIISSWLDGLPPEDRTLFVRRYWYGEALNALAVEGGVDAGTLAGRMYRLRQALRAVLEREGIAL